VADFDSAFRDRALQPVRGREIPFLGRAVLMQNTRATGRTKDLGDLEALGGEGIGGPDPRIDDRGS
jgi:hypothetical protein